MPTLSTIREIRANIPGYVPLSVALGDAENNPDKYAKRGIDAANAGADIVKVGLYGFQKPEETIPFLAGIRESLDSSGFKNVLLVGAIYADRVDPRFIFDMPAIAARCGLYAILIDTYGKSVSVRDLLSIEEISLYTDLCRDAGIFSVLAGGLCKSDAGWIRDTGLDIAGFRSAVVKGSRSSTGIDMERISGLYEAFRLNDKAVSK